jgi:protein tyrosine/serine phosphatase
MRRQGLRIWGERVSRQLLESGWSAYGKPAWKGLQRLRRATLGWRRPLIDHAPPWARRIFGSTASHLDMLFIDHGIFRVIYLNRHCIGGQAWRSAQPTPHQIRVLARQGLRTIINLRGPRLCGSYWLEQATCERKGIALVDFHVRSRAAPTREQVWAAVELFERIEYPMLLHCKSGADRAGLMSVLFRHLREGVPLEEARHELSLRYGHFRSADTGILDYFFERYIEDNRRRPMPFLDWVDTVYDPVELERTFRSKGWANRFIDQVLGRE